MHTSTLASFNALEKITAYQFAGKHLFANYFKCDVEALNNHEQLLDTMIKAVELSGATLLQCVHHEFHPKGFAVVMLLSESHASIHTYPEHQACFIDIFTCGDHCDVEIFEQALREYLLPQGISKKIYVRGLEVVQR